MQTIRSLHRNGRGAPATAAVALLAAVLAVVLPSGAYAADGPTPEVLAPVRALVTFMSTLPAGEHARTFASRGVTIIENFPPYVFVGPDAVARWEEGFRAHVATEQDTELKVEFGPAQDFGVSGARAYFSLPTIWTGRTGGKRFEERGAWSFVLVKAGKAWRILGYGWGVTSETELPP